MPFSEEDKALIKNLHLFKGYGSRRLLAEFSMKNWTKAGLDSLLKKLEGQTESVAVADQRWHVQKKMRRQ